MLARRLAAVLIPLGLLLGFAGWALASPVGATPDEDYHLASIWCGAGLRDGLCEEGDAADERRVPAALIRAPGCYGFQPEASGACDLPPSDVLVNTARGNFNASYPPVYYATLSVFAGPDIGASVVVMRLVNGAFAVAALAAMYLLLRPGRRGPYLWAGLVSIVPLGMFLLPSINPSGWAILSSIVLWVAITEFFTEPDVRRRVGLGVLATVMTIAAAGARGDAAAYSALAAVVAGVLAFERSRTFALRAILPAALVVVAAVFFLTAGQSGVLAFGMTGESRVEGGLLGSIAANLVLLPQLWAGALGYLPLGWVDTWLPGLVWVPTVGLFVGLVFWGLQVLGRRKAIALGLVFAALVVVPMYVLVKENLLVGQGVQPRYILPLMIMFLGIALRGLGTDSLRLNRVQLVLAGALVAIANLVALHTNLRRYVTGTDVAGLDLDTGAEWWWPIPVGPMAVWAIGSLGFALAVGMLVGTLLASSRHAEDADASDRPPVRDLPAAAGSAAPSASSAPATPSRSR